MNLKNLLMSVHAALKANQIDHALIGAFAMANYGVQRATGDIDFLIDEKDKQKTLNSLKNLGFTVSYESDEVLQFEGPGGVDFLLAKRELSRKMLEEAMNIKPLNIKCISIEGLIGLKIQAYKNNPKRELRDKADILSLIEQHPNLNWDQVKQYAELFDAWNEIVEIRKKIENDQT